MVDVRDDIALPTINAHVQVCADAWSGLLPTRIDDLDEDDDGDLVLVVPAPDTVDGPVPTTVMPEPGTAVEVHWTHPRGVSALPTEVVETSHTPMPCWRLVASGPVHHVQRRQAVRVAVRLGVLLEVDGEALRAATVDLSEGGLRCVVQGGLWLRARDRVSATLHLDDRPVTATVELLRARTVRGEREVTGRFLDLPEADADRIRRYVFAEQVAERARRRGER